jgi:hypothetical protein
MANIIQRRRGTTAQHATFTGAEGEITIDLDKDTVVVHDGTVAGGHPLAREDMSNVVNLVGVTQLNLSEGTAGQVIKTDGAGTISFTSQPNIGAALVGGDVTGSIASIQIAANTIGVTELKLSDGTAGQIITTDGAGNISFQNAVDISMSSVGGDVNGTVGSIQINTGAVGNLELANDAVRTIHILDSNVTNSKLAFNAVESNNIADQNVTNIKIVSMSANKLTGALPSISGFSLTNINPATHSHVGVNPYDVSFIAGYDSETLPIDIVVQKYGEMIMARTGTFEGEVGVIDTAGTGSTVIVDVEKNGSSIYTVKPTFADGQVTAQAGTLSTTSFIAGDKVTFKVTMVGSTTTGQGLRFMLKCLV